MKISYLLHVNQHKTMFSKVQTAYPTMKKNCLLMKLRINALIATFISFKFLMIVCVQSVAQTPDDDFGYKDWPGKDDVVKQRIELPVTSFVGYGLRLTPTFNDSIVRFDLPLSAEDTFKMGRFYMQIFPTIERTHFALLNHLYAFQSNIKPLRLEKEEFPLCDVVFGLENEDTSYLYFCKNNVFIIIESTTIFSKGLYEKIASIVQIAPVWSSGSNPSFIVSKEFVNYFQRKDQD